MEGPKFNYPPSTHGEWDPSIGEKDVKAQKMVDEINNIKMSKFRERETLTFRNLN